MKNGLLMEARNVYAFSILMFTNNTLPQISLKLLTTNVPRIETSQPICFASHLTWFLYDGNSC